jgi:2-methylcitrate dehydratase PrpD
VRDNEHIEKAFDFGGMGARNGVTAALMVQSGFTGVREVLDGEHNMIDAMSREPRPEEMVAGLGTRFFVTETAIKTFSVGYPIQAPLDALLTLRRQHGLTADNVERIVARLPEDGANIVNGRTMPDVNIQYVLAVGLLDGTVSFVDSHSFEKMKDPRVMAVMKRVELVGDRALVVPDAPRSGHVEVTLRDGRRVNHFTRHAPGTKENPVDAAAINAKVRDLMAPVIGASRTEEVIRTVHAIEQVKDVREFVRSLLAV